jgi:hypothetical protein
VRLELNTDSTRLQKLGAVLQVIEQGKRSSLYNSFILLLITLRWPSRGAIAMEADLSRNIGIKSDLS